MSRRSLPTAQPPERLDLQAIDELIGLHREKLLRLVSSVDDGQPHHHGNRYALVTEILRLARVGAIAEERASRDPRETVQQLVKEAAGRWRVEIGGA